MGTCENTLEQVGRGTQFSQILQFCKRSQKSECFFESLFRFTVSLTLWNPHVGIWPAYLLCVSFPSPPKAHTVDFHLTEKKVVQSQEVAPVTTEPRSVALRAPETTSGVAHLCSVICCDVLCRNGGPRVSCKSGQVLP